MAGDVHFVFASRLEMRDPLNKLNSKLEIIMEKRILDTCQHNQCKYLLEETYLQSFLKITAMLVRLAQTISSKYYILLFPLNLITTIIAVLLVYATVCSDVIIARGFLLIFD